MKSKLLITALILFALSLQAQNLNIHKTDGSILTIAISNIDSITFLTSARSIADFCNAIPIGWSCKVYENSFDSLQIVDGTYNPLDNPIAKIVYSNDSILCHNSRPAFLNLDIYDISQKDTLEKIIEKSSMFSWCIPIFFGENERYYVITSPCYFFNGCRNDLNIKPFYQAIKGLFTKSVIE
jgi:hypothetical protein